jgi:hypothetical protein
LHFFYVPAHRKVEGVLRFAEERTANFLLACLSSHRRPGGGVGLWKILSWWSGRFCGTLQHDDPLHHVRVLFIQCLEPKLQHRHLVEKICDFAANSKLENFHNWCFNNLKIKRYCYCSQVQHFLIFISILPAVVNVNCTYPKGWAAFFTINMGFLVYLFGRFYKNTYLTKKKNK